MPTRDPLHDDLAHPVPDALEPSALEPSALGSGLLARQPTSSDDPAVAVARVCPQCGEEYETGDRFCPRDGSPLRPRTGADPLIGRVLAERYLVLALIGEGGMGRVYLAEHVKMARQCAVKVMNPSLMHDSESLARFAREASSAAGIIHPNVAAVFDYGESDHMVYLVMEFVDGESLSAILRRERRLDPRRAVDIARQVANGLAAAHELGIVHRDLKPDNVIVTRTRAGREVAKVVDFGIAKAITDLPADALTRSGLVIGTPEYMSPEQLLGDPVDPRADIYSLGCMLYQMLAGEQPFAAETREQTIRRRLHEPPPHIRDLRPALPRRLDTLIIHMLARAPADRLASAAAARDALDPSLSLAGWKPAATDPREVADATVWLDAATVDDPTLEPTAPMPRRKRMSRSVRPQFLVVSLVAVAALVTAVLLSPRPEEEPVVATSAATAVPSPSDSARVASNTTPPAARQAPAARAAIGGGATASPATRSAASLSRTDSATRPARTPAKAIAISDADAVRAALERFGAASARGVAALVDAVPSLSPQQLEAFQRVYSIGESIHSTTRIGEPIVLGDRAEVPFTLVVAYLDTASKTQSSVRLRYRALLTRHGARWEIAELRVP